jgi:hypothetical protein
MVERVPSSIAAGIQTSIPTVSKLRRTTINTNQMNRRCAMNEIANAIQKEACGHLDRNTLARYQKSAKVPTKAASHF